MRESKTVLDSGFLVMDSGIQVLDSSLCQWNLDSGFLELHLGFQIPGFWILQAKLPQILDSMNKNFPYSRIQILLHWTIRKQYKFYNNIWELYLLSSIRVIIRLYINKKFLHKGASCPHLGVGICIPSFFFHSQGSLGQNGFKPAR